MKSISLGHWSIDRKDFRTAPARNSIGRQSNSIDAHRFTWIPWERIVLAVLDRRRYGKSFVRIRVFDGFRMYNGSYNERFSLFPFAQSNFTVVLFFIFSVPKKNSNRFWTCSIRFQSTATVNLLMSCSAAKTTLEISFVVFSSFDEENSIGKIRRIAPTIRSMKNSFELIQFSYLRVSWISCGQNNMKNNFIFGINTSIEKFDDSNFQLKSRSICIWSLSLLPSFFYFFYLI